MNAIRVRVQGSGFRVQRLARERFRPAANPGVLTPEPRTLNPFGRGCAAIGWIGLLTILTAGCASWTASIPRTENISKQRQARAEAAVRRFHEQRGRAELELARSRWQQGDVDGSTETLVRLLDRNPDDVEARLLLAESLLVADRPGEAVSYLEPAIAARPNDARLHHMMGLLLDSMGRFESARIHYERAKELEPGNDVYAVSFQAVVEPDEGADDIASASEFSVGESRGEPLVFVEDSRVTPRPVGLTRKPASSARPNPSEEMPKSLLQPAIPVQDSRSLLRQCAAIEEFSPLPEPAPTVRNVHAAHSTAIEPARRTALALPEARLAGSERADSVQAIDSVESDDSSNHVARPSASELLQRGSSAMLAGRKELALTHFREATALAPHDPHIPISAAVSALRHNYPDVAVSLLEPLREVFAESVAVCRILATAHYRLGDYKSSQVAIQQALSLDKSSALSYFLMGCTLVKLGQPAVAETHFRQARTLDPRYAIGR